MTEDILSVIQILEGGIIVRHSAGRLGPLLVQELNDLLWGHFSVIFSVVRKDFSMKVRY